MADACITSRRSRFLVHLLVAALLCMAGQLNAAPPDLTAGGVPTDGDQWNLGPTGMAGWCYREGNKTTNARQFLVRSVAAGSPADGIMSVNDVILGASGTGADPVNMTMDARIAFAQAITDAEERNPANLKILRWRAGVTSIVSLTLETLGAYSTTAPYDCPKSAAILEKGLQYMMATNANDNNWRYSALTLLAANDPNNPNNAARQSKAYAEMRQLILSPESIALFTSGISMAKNQKPWHIGPKLIALSEYYLQTGDPDVLPSIRAYAHCAANGQSMFGTSGHFFTDPGFRNTPVNGPYNIGYGPVNNAGLPCYIGLVLANKCGLNDPEILAGIERAGTFFAQYTHLGCAGYGEHLPYEGHDTNGKAGLQALAFQLEGDRLESTKYYARASTAAAIAERDIGHTGSYFAFLYAPLGANVGGPDAMAYYFRETKWMYELARRWDGSFVYNSFSSGGVEVDALSGPAGALMATPMLMTYAMPLRQTYLTGKNQNTANWITPAEMPEVSAASAHIYNAPSRTTTELVSDLSSWSPKVRRYAGRELKLRTADHATVLPTLHATAADEQASFYARAGACLAMGEIGNSSSVPVLLPLVTHSNFVVRFSASLAIRYMPATANKPHVDALMQACITNAKPLLPLDAQDPMQTVNGNLCAALFAPHAALYTHDLVGLNRELLYGAMRVCAANAQADVRNGLHTIYPKLTHTDIEMLGDVFVNIAYENAPAGMGVTGARLPAMSFLQSKAKAEGVPLAIRFAEDIGYNGGGIVDPLNLLADYAASSLSVTPNPGADRYCENLISNGAKYGIPEAQAVLDAIAADLTPEILTYFKNIDWIIPDHATFNLPKKWTVLRVHSINRSNPNSIYTWRKLRGAGAVSFMPNGTGAAKDTTVVFDGTPGEYLFEVTMSDSHGLTEVSETVTVILRNSGGNLPSNSPPTANGQSISAAQGTPTQVILTGADPEGYALNYTVTNGPAHGYLSGTAPHLVYTAAANYTGADSITFEVEDSEGQTATASVSITVDTAAPVGLAIYEPFNYPAGNLQGKSGASEIGLTGTWTAGSQITTEAPSLTHGTLPSTGNRVRSVGMNSPGGSRPLNPAALAGRGLMDNGATLWFSVVMGGYGGYDASGNLFHLALANNGIAYTFPSSYTVPDDGSIPGSGLGVKLQSKGVYAAQFAATGAPLTGDFDNTVTGGIVNDNHRLVVGKITWGATSDTIEIYLPEQDMILPSKPASVLTANVDQSTFDTLTFSRGSNVLIDEIRFGATLQSVLQGTVAMSPDVTAPAPNPMTFAVAPTPASSSSITMTATPALDGMGVEYKFTCTAGGGNSSDWQTSNVYTDTGLTPGVAYSYNVKARDQHPALNETTASAAASATIPALGTVPGVEGMPEAIAQSLITNAALTVGAVTQSASYSMTVPAGHVLSQSPADGASVAYGSAVNIVISIGQEPSLPVLTPVNIVDNKNGQQVELGTPITYTLTFSKDIDAATLDAGDFINAGNAPLTLGAITEISPGVVTVTVTPSGTVAGFLRFAIAAGAVIEDTLGNDLNTTSPIIDNTVISIVPVQPKTQTFTGNSSSSGDNWNAVLNWNLNTGPIPTGTDNVIIPAGKVVTSNSTATPIYGGNLSLGVGAQLQASYNVNSFNNYNCLGTAGTTTISMGDGSRISFRENYSVPMPAIILQGNAEITTGSSTSPGSHPIFNYPITGPYALTLSGKSPNITNFNVANNFGHLILSTQYGNLFTVNANAAGSLSGDVTVNANYTTGGKGANLVFATANAMADTATLTLYGNTGSLVTVNASDTIGGLKLNGVKQLPGTYNSGNSTWLTGAGTLTVAGETMAYWNPTGAPTGNWDDSNIWNTQADLAGTNNAWAPGQIAAFNAAGTYGVTLSDIKEIGGLAVSNGTVTLSDGGLSLSSDAPLNVASGATLSINTVIEQNSLGLGLHKSGAGILNLLGENTFTGPVAIGAGTLSIATIDNAGAPSALGQYPDAGTGGLILAGGTLRYTGGSTAVNRGFTFTGSSSIDINNPGSSLTLGDVETAGPGTLTATGGAGSNLFLGNIKIVQSNNITLDPATTTMHVASVEGYSNYPLAATVTLGGSSTGNVVTGNIFASVYPESPYQQGIALIKNGTSDWKIAGVISSGGVAYVSVTINEGTLTLAGDNTFTGYTLLNNNAKLVLDFAATNTSKLASAELRFSGGTLELKGGSHIEVVSSTTLNAGPSSFITRNSGTAKLRMNALNRNAGGTISFLDGTVADTDRVNTNGILGGYATVGTDWAVNSINGTDGAITPLSTYAILTSTGGEATANYLLSGSGTLTGSVVANSLKITNTNINETLSLGASNLTITTTSATALGGVLYAGEGFDRCTISGTGGLLASSTTGELIVHTSGGTLTVNAPVVTSGATAGLLTKSGNGSLVLGGSNVYTGATRVASGKLFVNGSISSQNAALTVDPGATLGGSGTVGRNITIADGGKLEFNISTAAASHVPLTRSSSRTFAFSGSSVLTITSNSGATPGLYTLVTGGSNITGSAPATVILPPGWTADPPVISTNQLRINITSVVNPPNSPPVWSSNPLGEINATEDAAYSATLFNNASDFNNDPLIFAKVSGPAWLSVAANGALSGTPDNSNVGTNSFTVSVSDGIAAPVEVTLNITVININDTPVWNSNPLAGPNATEDAAYSQNMATAAADVDSGATLSFAKVSGPSWLNVAANGTISGTPTNASVGLNVFTITASDGIAAPVEVTLHINVINTNDAPVWSGNPIAGANAVEDSAYTGTVAGNATDVDGGASLTFTKFSGPSWLSVAANGALSGIPANEDVGVNVFTVRVSDGIAAAVSTTLAITVINTNDAPLALAQSVVTEQDSALPVTLTGSDVDVGGSLTYATVTQPAHGTLSGTAPNLVYTPTPGYNGPDSFTFKVNDGSADSAVATVSITVTILNDPPVALAQSVTTDEDIALPITLTGTDPDENPLTYSIVTQPTKGTLSGTGPNRTYTPTTNSNGSDSFTFKVNDGLEDSPVATVSITVNAINDAPVFTTNPIVLAGSIETVAFTGQTLAGRATDVDSGDTLTYSIVSGPSWLVVDANGALTGTPPNGSAGTNSFVVRAADSASTAADATLQINVSINGLTWDANGTGAGQTNGAGAWLGASLWWDIAANTSWIAGSNAIFGGQNTSGGAVTLASPTTVSLIQFNTFTGTYTLGTAGQALTITSGIRKTSTAGAVTFASPVTLGGAQIWTNSSSGTLMINDATTSAINGTGNLTLNGIGRVSILGTATGAPNYSGNISITGGGEFESRSNVTATNGPLGTGNIAINGGTLGLYYNNTFTRAIGTGAGQIQITGGVSGFSGNGGSGNVFTLAGMIWGSAAFNPDQLVMQNATANSTGAGTLAGNIDLGGATRTIRSDQPGGDLVNGRGIFSGAISNGGIIKEGIGQIVFTGTNTYTGGTTINTGTLRFDSIASMPASGAIAINGGASLGIAMGGAGQWTSGISGVGSLGGLLSGVGGAGTSTVAYSGDVGLILNVTANAIYSGTISNPAGASNLRLTKIGGSTLTLTGSNSYAGVTSILSGGITTNTLADAGSNSGIGAFPTPGPTGLFLNGSTFTYTGPSVSTNRGFTYASGSNCTLNVSGTNVALIMGDIASNSVSGLNVTGGAGSSVVFTGATLTTSELVINPGIPTTIGTVTLNGSRRVDNQSGTAALNVSGVNLGAYTITFSGAASAAIINNATNITGSGNVIKSSTTTWSMSGSSSYTGTTAISQGTLVFDSISNVNGGSSALGAPANSTNGTIALGNGANTVVLRYTGTGHSTNRVLNLAGTTGSATLDMSGTGTLTFTSALTATGAGSKTLTLSGSTAGIGVLGGAIVNNSGTNITSLSKTGTGIWMLSGSNSYTGTTTVNAGTLLINGNQTSATGNVSVVTNATLGGTGTIGGNTTIADGGKLVFDISTATAGHNPLDIFSGKSLTFTGASELTITSSGGMAPGTYTLITGGGDITGAAPATVNMPAGWTGTARLSGNNLLLDVAEMVDHFVISAIGSTQAVGVPITGITITAQTASNQTASGFTGTVTFGGTAGITGTSANFDAGVLSGVSVTPTTAGSNLTLTVNDGAGHAGSITISTVQTPFAAWTGGGTFTADANNDGIANGLAWVLGAGNKNANATSLQPTFDNTSDPDYFIYTYRRNDAANADPNTTITVKYGSDLGTWTTAVHDGTNIIITPTDDGAGAGIDTVQVKIKRTLAVGGKLFARLNVVIAP